MIVPAKLARELRLIKLRMVEQVRAVVPAYPDAEEAFAQWEAAFTVAMKHTDKPEAMDFSIAALKSLISVLKGYGVETL